jgi:hypothetical protein
VRTGTRWTKPSSGSGGEQAWSQAAFAFALISGECGERSLEDGNLRPSIREALAAAHRATRIDEGHLGGKSVYEHVSADLIAAPSLG